MSPDLGREGTVAALGISFDLCLIKVETREFEDPAYVTNTTNRC